MEDNKGHGRNSSEQNQIQRSFKAFEIALKQEGQQVTKKKGIGEAARRRENSWRKSNLEKNLEAGDQNNNCCLWSSFSSNTQINH